MHAREYHHNLDASIDHKTIWQKHAIDPILTVLIIALVTLSCFTVFSAVGDNTTMFYKHLRNLFIGIVCLLIVSQIKTNNYIKVVGFLYLVSVLLLVMVKFFGVSINYSQRWLDLHFFNFQPTELAKVVTPIYICKLIVNQEYPLSFKLLLQVLVIMLIPFLLIAGQPDLGSALLLAIGSFTALFIAGISWTYITVILTLSISSIPIVWNLLLHDYQKQRILTLFNPEKDILGSGWNIVQSKTAIGSGGFNGKGWLQGTQSHLDFLPEGHTDFIISVYSEEFGFKGFILLFCLYIALFLRACWISQIANSRFNKLIAGIICITLLFAFFVNCGMVSGILPVVGIPLPLFSYGGTSLLTYMFSFGILLSIWREAKNIN